MFASIECRDCPGHKKCPKPQCEHCVMEREKELHSKDALVALPYFYQDVGNNDTTESDRYVLRHVQQNGTIHYRIQESIPRYSNEKIQGSTFSVSAYGTQLANGQVKNSLIDSRVQWSEWRNIWQNAGIRSGLYMPVAMVKKVFNRGTGNEMYSH